VKWLAVPRPPPGPWEAIADSAHNSGTMPHAAAQTIGFVILASALARWCEAIAVSNVAALTKRYGATLCWFCNGRWNCLIAGNSLAHPALPVPAQLFSPHSHHTR
jgi:hypothetical protein